MKPAHIGFMITMERGRVSLWRLGNEFYVADEQCRLMPGGWPMSCRTAPCGAYYAIVLKDAEAARIIGLELL